MDSSRSLELYLSNVGTLPNGLPLDEEKRLARLGTDEARNELVMANLRFVVSYVKRFRHRGASYLDLIQAGNMGLLIAAEKFNPERDTRFILYAFWWIRAEVMNLLSNSQPFYCIPVHLLDALIALQTSKIEASVDAVREYAANDISDDLARDLIETALMDMTSVEPLASLVSKTIFIKTIEEEEDLARRFAALLKTASERLTPKQLRRLKMLFGIDGPKLTIQEATTEEDLKSHYAIRYSRDNAINTLKGALDV